MAATADSSSNRHSDGATAVSGDISSNPRFLPSDFPSPWGLVVRGEQESVSAICHPPPPSSSSLAMSFQDQTSLSDSFPSQAADSPPPVPPGYFGTCETSDASSVNAAAQTNKPVWNNPSNGIVEIAPLMGAVSWPALSESTKSTPKFQSESSSKPAADGSHSTSQEPANPPLHQKHATSNAKHNSKSNHTMPVGQRFNRRGSNNNSSSIGGGPTRGGFIRPSQTPSPPPSFPGYGMPPNSYGNLVPPMADTSLLDPSLLNYNWATRPVGGFISQHHPVSEHSGRPRRGNFNPHMCGDGIHHNSRGRPARDGHMHQQRANPRNFMAHASTYTAPTHFLSPQPVRAIGNPMGYQELVYFQTIPFEHYGGPQLMPNLPIIQPSTYPPLSTLLLNQINYYFCDDNLEKDRFLKSHMDDEGWVSIDLIANFPRVKTLTDDIGLILNSLKSSAVVEVQDDKVRRRDDWIKWSPNKDRTAANSPSSESSQDMMTTFKNLKLEEEGSRK